MRSKFMKRSVLSVTAALTSLFLAGCASGDGTSRDLGAPRQVTGESSLAYTNHPLDNSKATLPTPTTGGSDDFVWPISGTSTPDWIASPFGPRFLDDDGGTYDFHPALDLLPVGTEDCDSRCMSQSAIAASPPAIHPVIAGRVDSISTFASPYPQSGKVVRLKHRMNQSGSWTSDSTIYFTVYAHMSDFCYRPGGTGSCQTLAVGTDVDQADQIGSMGNTGADFYHLHFEIQGHSAQFYSVNPLLYLPHTNTPPGTLTILDTLAGTTTCDVAFSTSDPRFWVTYSMDHQEPDGNLVQATVFDRATCASQTKLMDIQYRMGITRWQDRNNSGLINPTGTAAQYDASGSAYEYSPDDRATDITPIFDDCGTPERNHFTKSDTDYTMEVEFDGFTTTGTDLQIDATVSDIFNQSKSVTVLETTRTCTTSSDCSLTEFACKSCQCLAVATDESAPCCSASPISCSSPCQGKTAACVNNKCVAQ